MILVTVGTHAASFNRLVNAADELAAELKEPVVIQRGYSTYEPHTAEHFRWAGSTEMERLVQKARVVIAHAGAGTIIQALLYEKPLIVVPRLAGFGESIDNHQQQLALALVGLNKAVAIDEPSAVTLHLAIDRAMEQKTAGNGAGELVYALQQQLVAWAAKT